MATLACFFFCNVFILSPGVWFHVCGTGELTNDLKGNILYNLQVLISFFLPYWPFLSYVQLNKICKHLVTRFTKRKVVYKLTDLRHLLAVDLAHPKIAPNFLI